ncbi:hypothetical protein [Thalassotalea sp. PLHSN55]|uniref:hypothetical protein n=1 Tax=Thalassotalea sp. PLHSN55 TaxID=3435888 RepID=UPI003F827447
MYNVKNIKISNLINDTSFYINRMLDIEDNWFDEITISSHQELSAQYANICHQYHQERKWILMINPEEDSLEPLSDNEQIDARKVLRVNSNKDKLCIAPIKMALQKGNCSAVIVSNSDFTQQQISELIKSAQRGKTQCIVINKKALH